MSSRESRGHFGRQFAVLLTSLIKLGGLLIALYEIFIGGETSAVVLGLAAFMMSGAQFSEAAVVAVLDRLLGEPSRPERQPVPKDTP